MTSALQAELCHITVHGPGGRADLSVPLSTTVAALLPALAHQVVRGEEWPRDGDEYGSWVLQRLGEAPMDPDGTPETLDWLDGEVFYLVRAHDPMPELDFDDVADGMATAVNRQGNRWNETANRRLFLSLTVVAFGTIAGVLFGDTSAVDPAAAAPAGKVDPVAAGAVGTLCAALLAMAMLTTAILVARTLADRGLAAVVGLASCAFAGLSGLIGVEGLQGAIDLRPAGVLAGGCTMAMTAAVLLTAQRTIARELPIVPFGIAAVVGVGAVAAVWLHLGFGLTAPQDAGVLLIAFFVMTLFAPKLATRAARLRGPQLPRRAEEMTIDVEPIPAELVIRQTGTADRYLSVLAIGSSLVFAVAFGYLTADPGWVGLALTGTLSALVLLRTREFLNVAQRVALAVAGTVGGVLFVLSLLAGLALVWRIVGVLVLLGIAVLLVLAALRPGYRRMLPIWGHLANILETVAAVAAVSFLMEALGVFAWARGLAG